MKSLITGAALIATIVALIAVPAFAQNTPMTEAHIERIRANCIEAQSSLTQLHRNDAGLRVNRGQLYEAISTKLMTPLNTRIVSSKLDGATLVLATTLYEQRLNEFRSNYTQYEESMAKTLRINCINQPVAFYDSVAESRTKRQLVYASDQAIQGSIQQYGDAFGVFKQKILQELES